MTTRALRLFGRGLVTLAVLVGAAESALLENYVRCVSCDVKMVEGNKLILKWNTNDIVQKTQCTWNRLNKTGSVLEFMAYEGQKRYGSMDAWEIERIDEPCNGVIVKTATVTDTGVYVMTVAAGPEVDKEESKATVQVFKSSDMKFSIALQGQSYDLDLTNGNNQTLSAVAINKRPIDVSVTMRGVFETANISITRSPHSQQCLAQRSCHSVMDFTEKIQIRIVTGIQGADHVIVTIPVTNTTSCTGYKIATICLVVLVSLVVIVFIAVMLWRKRRPSHQRVSSSVREESPL